MDSPVNAIFDENIELKKKFALKEEELMKTTEELKIRNKQIEELQSALNDITVQVKAIEDCLKNLKKIQVSNASLGHGVTSSAVVTQRPTASHGKFWKIK